jgi:hypothetical protein
VTSVTTRESQTLVSDLVTFTYRRLKPDLFWGYQVLGQTVEKHKMATLEKAILDYFLVNKKLRDKEDIEALRFNYYIIENQMDKALFRTYTENFDNHRVKRLSKILLKLIENA